MILFQHIQKNLIQHIFFSTYEENKTPLHYASENDTGTRLIELLISNGSDINSVDRVLYFYFVSYDISNQYKLFFKV